MHRCWFLRVSFFFSLPPDLAHRHRHCRPPSAYYFVRLGKCWPTCLPSKWSRRLPHRAGAEVKQCRASCFLWALSKNVGYGKTAVEATAVMSAAKCPFPQAWLWRAIVVRWEISHAVKRLILLILEGELGTLQRGKMNCALYTLSRGKWWQTLYLVNEASSLALSSSLTARSNLFVEMNTYFWGSYTKKESILLAL